ncbi:expressed unknown protein [Seminavis robusta]|uniref:Uncharacterized protein n=1 Tax=Seminavis robusta TaxID=568900 RepID=A0A9N8EVB9_9STRA|nr:expressed unknown protein [Seminavis robusta]|eukprot:Sro1985_g309430.1 n/a (128) ;mRNA; f:6810-7493
MASMQWKKMERCRYAVAAVVLLLATAVSGFLTKRGSFLHRLPPLFASSTNNQRHQEAMQAALNATQKYGAHSPEARVLWEIAEEIEDSIFSPCSERDDNFTIYLKNAPVYMWNPVHWMAPGYYSDVA